jgi:hypothetical protein
MIGQLERLIQLSRVPRLRVGVIPWTQRVNVFALHGFSMYDRRAVVIGTRAATAFITDPQDVATYSQFFDQLEAVASFGKDAEPIISEIADGYRQLS